MAKRRHRVTIAKGLLATLACSLACGNRAEPQPPKKAVRHRRGDPISAPHHSPQELAAAPAQRTTKTATGTLTASIDNNPFRFTFLPYGRNVAITGGPQIARITIFGSLTDQGLPSLQITLLGAQLDKLELPTVVPVGTEAPVRAKIRFRANETQAFSSASAPDPSSEAFVRLESLDGTTLTGSFAATLQPESHAGKPQTIADGRFEVTLRQGGPRAPDTKPPSPGNVDATKSHTP